LHDSEFERQAAVVAWVRDGLGRGEKVIYTETGRGTDAESFVGALDDKRVDAEPALADGRLAVLPSSEFYRSEGQVEAVRRALADGHPAVRIAADAAAARAALSEPEYTRFEKFVQLLCQTHPVSALCQYSRHGYSTLARPDAELRYVVEAHPGGVRDRLVELVAEPGRLALAGEIDISNEAMVMSAVGAAANASLETLELDMAEVRFISVSGWRAIAAGTDRFRARGGRVRLTGSQRAVARSLRMCGLDRLPGILIDDG
jgi:anti-anti-sigma factor